MVSTLEERAAASMEEKTFHRIRRFTGFLFDCFYSLRLEGEIPKERPAVLIPTHQNSLDSIAIMRGVDEYVAFLYVVTLRSTLAAQLGLHINGIHVKEDNRVWFKRLFERLDHDSLVVAFPQGNLQGNQVVSYKSGFASLIEKYESLRHRQVPLIPVGIEYGFPSRLPRILPFHPFKFPCFGTSVTMRFGEPKHLDGRTPQKLTEVVMREAAELSRIPYKADTPS